VGLNTSLLASLSIPAVVETCRGLSAGVCRQLDVADGHTMVRYLSIVAVYRGFQKQ
jgi:hypothetical protein